MVPLVVQVLQYHEDTHQEIVEQGTPWPFEHSRQAGRGLVNLHPTKQDSCLT